MRIWLALGALVLLAMLLGLLGPTEPGADEPETRPLRSTYRSRPSGLRALYLTLERLGYRPRRHVERLDRLPGDGVLVIAEPVQEIDREGWQALAAWVERGNLLLLFSDSGRLFEAGIIGSGPPAPGPTLRPRLVGRLVASSAAPVQPAPVTVGAPEPVVQSAYRLRRTAWDLPPLASPSHERRGERSPPSSAGRGAGEVGLIPLYADPEGPVLSVGRRGKGTVVLSCSPWSISNEGIAKGSNLALFLNLVDVYGGGKRRPIYFDEYHQGRAGRGGPLGLLAPVARFGVAQIVLALLLLVLAVAWRFGPALPVEALERRSRAEYLAAMTGLFRRARALELVAAKLGEETRRELARGLGLPPSARPEAIAAAARTKRGVEEGRVREILAEADALAAARARQIPLDERRVHAAAQRLHDLREELLGR